jgi:hypothetical protein
MSFFATSGTLRHDAPSYVERDADQTLYEQLLKGAFCYVLTSRQMGKSSLMARTSKKLRDQGLPVINLDLTAIGQNLTLEQWYDGLVLKMGEDLHLEDPLDSFWRANSKLSPVQRFFSSIRQCKGCTRFGGTPQAPAADMLTNWSRPVRCRMPSTDSHALKGLKTLNRCRGSESYGGPANRPHALPCTPMHSHALPCTPMHSIHSKHSRIWFQFFARQGDLPHGILPL